MDAEHPPSVSSQLLDPAAASQLRRQEAVAFAREGLGHDVGGCSEGCPRHRRCEGDACTVRAVSFLAVLIGVPLASAIVFLIAHPDVLKLLRAGCGRRCCGAIHRLDRRIRPSVKC